MSQVRSVMIKIGRLTHLKLSVAQDIALAYLLVQREEEWKTADNKCHPQAP
jgi:hypothetical protein